MSQQTAIQVHPPYQRQTLSVAETADYTGFTQSVIRDAIAAGALKSIRIGRKIRITISAIDRFLVDVEEGEVDLGSPELQRARRASWRSYQQRRRRSSR